MPRNVNLRSTKRHVLLEVMAGDRPVCIVKYPRAQEESFLRNEAETLDWLHHAGLCTGPVSTPRLIGQGVAFNRIYLIQDFAEGEVPARLEENEAPAIALVDWLADVMSKAREEGTLTGTVQRMLDRVLPKYPAVEAVKRPTEAVAGRYRPVLMHGDLSYQNLLVRDGAVSLIDWEYARADGIPMADVLDFLLYDLYRDTKDYGAAVRGLFSGNRPQHWALLKRYCRAGGISDDDIRPLFQLFVLSKLDLLVRLSAPRAEQKAKELLEALSESPHESLQAQRDPA